MFNRQIEIIRITFELFPRVNFNQIQQGYSKLKTSVEFHSLENRSQSEESHSKYFKMHHVFRQFCGSA